MSSSIPDHVDVIIIGTSLTNSIIAAACSRIGKSVLHLDKNSYYGGTWASFTFQQLIDWIRIKFPTSDSLHNVPEELINKSRLFCIDLAPKFLFSNGDMVNLLVKSNVARYHEFKNNIRILCLINDCIHVMPCRRNEVFTSSLLSNLADKRRLMKLVEICMRYDPDIVNEDGDSSSEVQQNAHKSISDFLDERGIRTDLKEYIINSIAMVKPSETTSEACKKIKKFMVATERYGRSPFLFPLYGCGEFPQSFCRLSAVFGGLYCLNTKIHDIVHHQGKTSSELPCSNHVDCSKEHYLIKFSEENYEVKSDMLVIEDDYAIDFNLIESSTSCKKLNRAILITNKSIVPNANDVEVHDLVSFLRIPPCDKNVNTIFLIELNSSALVCPKDLNIVYLWTQAVSSNPEDDLKSTVMRLFKDESCVMWKFYFQQPSDEREYEKRSGSSESNNLHVTNSVCDDIDYISNIRDAERLFKKMFTGEEFLPRAPDPDEIDTSG